MRHTFEEIVTRLDMLTSGKSYTRFGNENVRVNAYGDLFEFDVPRMMFGDRLVKSTSKEDMENHIDWYIDGESYDFKAPKRKYGKFQQAGEIVIEWTNVNGNKGWLRGEEKYLMLGCIMLEGFFYLKYDRKQLEEYVKRNMNTIKWEESRKGDKDMFAWIVSPGEEAGLLDVYDITDFVDEALYQRRTEKFKLIQQLNAERNGNR